MNKIIDNDGIVYKEVNYNEYLQCKNKHRIIKHLEAQYFVETKQDGVEE